jgi:methyltransferase-like protein/SAM-dependent methyltransferase
VDSYEVVPYTSLPIRKAHPDALATIATLFGMTPPEVPRARVLEIGCASGGNLIPMGVELPKGSFLGIELSERQVAEGRATIEAVGLKNVALMQMSIMDAGPDLGTFDYIVCHGVLSWVAPEVQQQILSAIATYLAPDGVAYVSYNTYPGWYLRGIIRDAMLYHIDGDASPQEGIRKGREILDLLVQVPWKPDNYYLNMISKQRGWILEGDSAYVFHEFLEEANHPLYYREFLEAVATRGLKAVADAEFPKNACVAPRPIKEVLERMSPDPARQEQYYDFLMGRTFRSTTLCHEGRKLLSGPSAAAVEGLAAASKVMPGSLRPGFAAAAIETFQNWRNQPVTIDHPVLKAAVVVLGENYPCAVRFGDLWRAAMARLSDAGLPVSEYGASERRRLAEFLLLAYSEGWLELSSHIVPFVREPGERPAATVLARHQARAGVKVVNLRHEPFDLPRFDRHLLELLDGSRTHGELVDALDGLVTEGKLTIRGSDPGAIDAPSRRAIVAESLRQGLARLAAKALLVA